MFRQLRTLRRARSHVEDARRAASDRVVGWQPPLPDQPSPRVFLPPDLHPPGSVSVGKVSTGRLVDAESLPVEGPHHAIIDRHRDRGTRWGTERMIALLEGAAEQVARQFPGSTLRVGNLSRRDGGDIRWSSSHNSGRDADLAFYARRVDTGRRVPTPALVEFGPDGRAVDDPNLAFDVPRNWALVEALLTDPDTDIQWLFISRPLKQKLLAHGRRTGASPFVLQRARKVLHQPTDVPPHADHLHVRIRCSRTDRLEGCLDYGPAWEWVESHDRALLARTLATVSVLRSGSEARQLRALDYLERIRSPYAPEVALLYGLDSARPPVRRRALEVAEAIPAWSATAVVAAADYIRRDDVPSDLRALAFSIVRRARDPLAERVALSNLLDRSAPPVRRARAARALSHAIDPGLVPVLLGELRRSAPTVRAAIATVLRRITLHSTDVVWEEASAGATAAAVADWRAWWRANRHRPRREWLLAGFERHGFDAPNLEGERAAGQLIDLLVDTPDHVAYNANRQIHEITGRWIPLEAWSYDRLHRYWSRWWENNREGLIAREQGTGNRD
ncbi:MAG: penicillin-insensitive murein endopeptidase [Bradymonadaceae bacterium]